MRTKLKRAGILLLCILFVAASTGAKPKLVSESEAKKAGLALINQVFGVTETEATVTLSEREGLSYINGEEQTTGKEEKVLIYVVTVPGKGIKATQYQAEVNAKTGVAFRASMNSYFLPAMTEEQRKLAETAGAFDQPNNYDYDVVSEHCYRATKEWIKKSFQPDEPILGFIDRGFISEESFPQMSAAFYAVMRDGTIYNIEMMWPQMAILSVGILNQIEHFEDEP